MKLKQIVVLFILTFILSLISENTFAQNHNKNFSTPDEFASFKAGKMKSRFSLTDDQYKDVYNLFLGRYSLKTENKNKNLSSEERKNIRNQHRQELEKQLEGILTPDQMIKFKEHRTQKKYFKQNKNINRNY